MQASTRITGVLVTGKSESRFVLARRAIFAWQQQLFNSCHELLVINDHPTVRMFPDGNPTGIREIIVPDRKTLGELRNIGIDNATSDYLVQWDDDDYSHPSRLLWQVEHTAKGRASIFRYEVHCDLTNTYPAFVNNGTTSRCSGFAGTMLWPRKCGYRFPSIGKHEDTEFVLGLKTRCGLDVLNNDPLLYCRFYHGANTWGSTHIMKPKPGSRELSPAELRYVNNIVNQTRKIWTPGNSDCRLGLTAAVKCLQS